MDMLIAENVSKRDAWLLRQWWSCRGHVYVRAAFGRGKHTGRFSVWLQR
jgi:hypothetical protein